MAENSILSPVSLTSYFDNATHEARQANLYFYKAQTLDPLVVYTDSLLRVPHAQPVATTGWGRVPPVYVGEVPSPGYRVRAFDQYNTLIEDLDFLPGALPTVAPPDPGVVDETRLAKTGDIKMVWANHADIDGWLECDGKTLGKDGSGANYQGTAVYDLYVWLWGQDAPDPYNLLPILPDGRGESADGDWNANRTIALPDAAGRFTAGLDRADSGSGTPPTASMKKRLDKGLFDKVTNPDALEFTTKAWMLGAHGGEDVHKLVVTELAVHLHDWWDTLGHTHYVYDPMHQHYLADSTHDHAVASHNHDTNFRRADSGYGLQAGSAAGAGDVGLYTTGTSINTGSTTVNITPGGLPNPWTNAVGTGIQILHPLWRPTGSTVPAGANVYNAYIGTYVAADTTVTPNIPWHYSNPTQNTPKANDGSNGAGMGDIPHNTLPPFILFAIYIKT